METKHNINGKDCWQVFKYDVVSSTNETAKKLCAKHHEKFVVTTDMQTKGKGQYGRKWLSPARRNLLATFCFPQREIATGILISFAAANAVCVVLKNNNFVPQCKWPNDIEIDDNKIAGILTEKIDDWLLIGIGLNLNWPDKKSELESGKRYTSLFAESNNEFNVSEFVLLLGKALKSQIEKSNIDILKLYKSFWNKKTNTEILVDNKWIPATQTEIDSDGALIVESTSKKIFKINTSAQVRINGIQNSKS